VCSDSLQTWTGLWRCRGPDLGEIPSEIAIMRIGERTARWLDYRANFTQPPAVAQKPPFHCDARASFAVAFGNWRRKNKIQLKEIAADLGVSISTVSSWEMGERFPGGRHFEMLVDYTGLPPCKLFCVMADKCVPADCLLAMSKIAPKPV
jgi:Helix-turn-helix